MAPIVHTPVEGFTGMVAGVNFSDGVGETDNLAALAYFESAGYDIEDDEAEQPESTRADESEGEEPERNESPNEESHDDDESGEESEDDELEGDASQSAEVTAPHPVKGNKAVWFEHLTTLNPNHGFDLEKVTRAELIAAVEELTAK